MNVSIEKLAVRCPLCGNGGKAKTVAVEAQQFVLCRRCGHVWTVSFVRFDSALSGAEPAVCNPECCQGDPERKQPVVCNVKIGCPQCNTYGSSEVLFDGQDFFVRHRNCGSIWRMSFEALGYRRREPGGVTGDSWGSPGGPAGVP